MTATTPPASAPSPADSMAAHLLPRSVEVPRNGDGVGLGDIESATYIAIDTINAIGRQGGNAIEAITLLAQASPAVASGAACANPIGLLVTGPLSVGTAIKWTLPQAWKALGDETDELAARPTPENERAVTVAQLGVANQSLYLTMGLAQTAFGSVTMASSASVGEALHYTPALTGSAASTATAASGVALGAIYIVRGTVMLVRAAKAQRVVNAFRKGLAEAGEQGAAEAKQFLDGESAKGEAYWKRRVEAPSAQAVDQSPVGYLAAVDKGIYSKELKNKISMIIGVAMIVGGILTIILATIFTGGVAFLIIGLVSAIIFMKMESVFIPYDNSRAFNALRDRLYTKPQWLLSAEVQAAADAAAVPSPSSITAPSDSSAATSS